MHCRYFQTKSGERDDLMYSWWHDKLADYFEISAHLQRKIEVVSIIYSVFLVTYVGFQL